MTMLFHNIAIIGSDGKTKKNMNVRIDGAFIASIEPVSYTHLDVYKRQVSSRRMAVAMSWP